MVSNGFIGVSEWFPFQSGAVSNGNSATFRWLRSAAQVRADAWSHGHSI